MLVPIFPAHSLLFCYLLGPWVGFLTLLVICTSAHPLFPQSAPAILTHLIYFPMLLGAILMVYLYHLLGSLQVLNTISLESDPISCHNLLYPNFCSIPLIQNPVPYILPTPTSTCRLARAFILRCRSFSLSAGPAHLWPCYVVT